MADNTLHCSVLTPEGPVFAGDVDSVSAVAADGSIGVLPGHAPLITALGDGELPTSFDRESSRKRNPSTLSLAGVF